MITIDIKTWLNGKRALLTQAGRILFPLILILWPFAGVCRGVDVADTTYSLTNFTWPQAMDPMWFYSTWLSNLTGAVLVRFPGGGTLRGMNIYCACFIAAIALLAWTAPWDALRPDGKRSAAAPLFRFLAVWTAESLCWCPAAILYNTLSVLFLTLASFFLLRAFTAFAGEQSERVKRRYYLLAGLVLGLAVFVRFPNLLQALLILPVWFHEILLCREESAGTPAGGTKGQTVMRRLLAATGVCLAGYITGVIIPLVIISLSEGPSAYFRMIGSLFSMTGSARDYSAGGMLVSVLAAYGTTCKELLLALPVLATGFGLFLYAAHTGRHRRLMILLYAILLALLFRWYLATGVFTRNYQYYDCMFELAMMAVILLILLCTAAVTGLMRVSRSLRSASLLFLVTILFLPLGSNNYTFPVVNDLFLLLPGLLLLLAEAARALSDPYAGDVGVRSLWKNGFRMPFLSFAGALCLLLSLQGALFHLNFAFGDGTDGTPRDTVIVRIPAAAGMHTTAANARMLESLYDAVTGELSEAVSAAGRRAVICGDAPGLHVLLGLRPALYTAWPDLDSNAYERVEASLTALAAEEERPLVILRGDASADPVYDFGSPAKTDLVLDYLNETGYNKLFMVQGDNGLFYEVYGCE